MTRDQVPLLILGGGDRTPGRLPPSGQGKHPITGCKGLDVRIGDRSLIEILIERLESSGAFGPIYVAGPAAAYGSVLGDYPVIDTDAGFGTNVQRGVDTLVARHPDRRIAISTCDILPEASDLERLLGHFYASEPADLWFPVIRAPQDPSELGASAWKPQYFIIPTGEHRAVRILPGHLTIVDPEALRLRFLYRLMDLGYRSRNRTILYRRAYMVRQLIFTMLTQDLLHLLQFRLPTFTWDIIRYGTVAARKLKDGVITQAELELAMRHIFSKRRHRKRHPERTVQIPVLEALSFARDIDTQEEAAAIGASIT